MSRDILSRAITATLWHYALKISNYIVGLIVWVLISRYLGVNVVGKTSSVIIFSSTLALTASLSISAGVERVVSLENSSTLRRKDMIKYIIIAILFLAFTSLISVTALLLLKPYVIKILGLPSNFPYHMILLLVIFDPNLLASIPTGYLMAKFRNDILFSVNLMSKILLFTLIYYSISFIKNPAFSDIVIPFLVSNIFNFVLLYAFLLLALVKESSSNDYKIDTKIDIKAVINHLLFPSITVWVGYTFSFLGNWILVPIVRVTSGDYDAGLIYIVMIFANFIYIMLRSVSEVLYPLFSSIGSNEELKTSILLKSSKIIEVLILSISLLLMGFGKEILHVFGADLAYPYLILILPIFPLIVFPRLLITYLYANEKYLIVSTTRIWEGLSKTILYFLLISWLGPFGGILSYSLGLILYPLIVPFLRRYVAKSSEYRASLNIMLPSLMAASVSSTYLDTCPKILVVFTIMIVAVLSYFKRSLISLDDLRFLANALLGEKR